MSAKYLPGLRQLLDKTLLISEIECITPDLCRTLAMQISRHTKVMISEMTLGRLYGFSEMKFSPSQYSLNVLAQYCGMDSWADWRRQFSYSEESIPANRFESKDFYKVFYYSEQPMCIFETQDLRFLEVNAAACNRYGYSRDRLLAMSLLDITPKEDVQRLLAAIGKAGPYCRHPEPFRHLLASGEVIYVYIVSFSIEAGGMPARLCRALTFYLVCK